MRVDKVTVKDGNTWITIKSKDDWCVIHLDTEITGVAMKGANVVIKTQ